jgi:steroid delta-isomerase-like uncharacterized protein
MTAIETNRATMTAYLDALVARGNYAQYFTQDVSVQVVGSDQQAHGRGAAEGMIRYLHEQAFDAHPELKTLLVDGERAAVEAEFVGSQVAEFAGIIATGKTVRVPYSVAYELERDRIKTLRIYSLMQGLLEQLSAPSNEALLRGYYEALADSSAMQQLLTEDFTFHAPNSVAGARGFERHRQFLAWHRGVLPDQHFEIEEVVADPSRGAVRWTLTGTQHAEFLGVAPTGRRVAVTGQDFFRVADGRIAELWRSFDLREMVRQLTSDSPTS